MATFQCTLGIIATNGGENTILLIKDIERAAQCSQRGVMGTVNKDFQWILVLLHNLGLHFGRYIRKESAHTQTATLLGLDCSVESSIHEIRACQDE